MNNPYETLSAPPDASPDAIKAAFRLLASANHPDREDGDAELMSEINAAYSLLSDPDRKARFDATGQTSEQASLDQEASNVLLQLFQQLLDVDQGMLLRQVRSSLLASKGNAQGIIVSRHSRTAKLAARRDSIVVKEGSTNLLRGLIDQQMQQMAAEIAMATKAVVVMTRAEELLDEYSSSEPVLSQQTYYSGGGTGTGHTTFFRSG